MSPAVALDVRLGREKPEAERNKNATNGGGRGRYFGQQILLDEHDEASGVLPLMSGSS